MSYRTRQGLTETETLGMTSADAALWGRVMSTVPWSLALNVFARSAANVKNVGCVHHYLVKRSSFDSSDSRPLCSLKGRFILWQGRAISLWPEAPARIKQHISYNIRKNNLTGLFNACFLSLHDSYISLQKRIYLDTKKTFFFTWFQWMQL